MGSARTFRALAIGLLPFALSIGVAMAPQSTRRAAAQYRTWSAYGGGPEQIRYSSLAEINTRNVARLQVAWTYETNEPGPLQTQPLVVGNVLFGYTPTHKTFAVNAATGKQLWQFDSGIRGQGPN